MHGYQFLHIGSFSRKSDAGGRTVDFVLGEAARRGDACQHVNVPSPPETVFGLAIDAVRDLHDARVAEGRTTNINGQSRKLRVDHHTLMTAIVSHPATVADAQEDSAVAADVEAWEERSVAWLCATWGESLVSVVRHVDEAHCHLHAFILPSGPDMRARMLHPGVAAKDREKATALDEGADGQTANARGDTAYKSALRSMQDNFWQSVGLPSGLARLGPARRRLTRDEWRTEQASAAATAELLRIAQEARQRTEFAVQEAATLSCKAEARLAAAADLETRARSVALRASAMVADAQQRAIQARAAADAADLRRLEAERQARAVSAKVRRVLEHAQGEAKRILGSARAEAKRIRRGARGLGGWFGAFVQGLRGVAPAAVALKAAAVVRAEEQALAVARAAVARIETERTQNQLQQTKTRLAAVSEAAARLGIQRDKLARELHLLRPAAPSNDAPTPEPL